ncbi:hypothetical protein AVEN_100245-1 [Araneus ventricosus]|uniref:Uncharacterized protein n=1 Tax=Araneus ventricosus TaxID=182803 RepID=A0A4Y2LII2_ARAVE|nr:hypothetical protein AVEN_100245-1 [Araneus ventricosus]
MQKQTCPSQKKLLCQECKPHVNATKLYIQMKTSSVCQMTSSVSSLEASSMSGTEQALRNPKALYRIPQKKLCHPGIKFYGVPKSKLCIRMKTNNSAKQALGSDPKRNSPCRAKETHVGCRAEAL